MSFIEGVCGGEIRKKMVYVLKHNNSFFKFE